MTISSVSAATPVAPQASNFSAMRQAFSQLSSALQSGDLTSAQSAYATLTQNGQGASGPFAQALSQIGDALNSGDTAKAQQALASLQQQTQSHRGHHHHGGGAKDATQSQTQTPASTSTGPSTATPSTVDVTA